MLTVELLLYFSMLIHVILLYINLKPLGLGSKTGLRLSQD